MHCLTPPLHGAWLSHASCPNAVWDGWAATPARKTLPRGSLTPPRCCCRWQVSQRFIQGLAAIHELELVGVPDMCVVAFRSARRSLNIYALNDLLSRRGWHLNALQGPAALHMCFTAQHADGVADRLLQVSERTWHPPSRLGENR